MPCTRNNNSCLLLSNQSLTLSTTQKLSWRTVNSACLSLAGSQSSVHIYKHILWIWYWSPGSFHRLLTHFTLYNALPSFLIIWRWTLYQLFQGMRSALPLSLLICPISCPLLGIPLFFDMCFPNRQEFILNLFFFCEILLNKGILFLLLSAAWQTSRMSVSYWFIDLHRAIAYTTLHSLEE